MPEYEVTFTRRYKVTETKRLQVDSEEEARTVAIQLDEGDDFFEHPDNLYFDGEEIQVKEVTSGN